MCFISITTNCKLFESFSVVTLVSTTSEDDAFNMFESLNTTGEPPLHLKHLSLEL